MFLGCKNQSKNIEKQNNIIINIFGLYKNIKQRAAIQPKNTPVHLEHTGN